MERAQGRAVHYLDFDVRTEIEALCGPMASALSEMMASGVRLMDRRVSGQMFLSEPVVQLDPLDDVQQIAAAVHLLRVELVKVMAALPVSQLPEGARARLASTVSDPAHGCAPEVSEDDVVTGRWVSRLVEHVEPIAADLAAVVAAQKAGRESDLDDAISDALTMPSRLGHGLTARVGMLERRLPELKQRYAAMASAKARKATDEALREQQRVQESLRRLGLS